LETAAVGTEKEAQKERKKEKNKDRISGQILTNKYYMVACFDVF
jgi:hypothetical protein